MAAPNPRTFHTQQVHYLRKVVNWNDTNIATGVKFGTLPAGAVCIGGHVHVTTAFNAGTTNSLSVGQVTTATELIAAASAVAGTAGVKLNIAPNASPFLIDLAADTDIYVLYAQTGTAASAGRAVITIEFAVNNDQ